MATLAAVINKHGGKGKVMAAGTNPEHDAARIEAAQLLGRRQGDPYAIVSKESQEKGTLTAEERTKLRDNVKAYELAKGLKVDDGEIGRSVLNALLHDSEIGGAKAATDLTALSQWVNGGKDNATPAQINLKRANVAAAQKPDATGLLHDAIEQAKTSIRRVIPVADPSQPLTAEEVTNFQKTYGLKDHSGVIGTQTSNMLQFLDSMMTINGNKIPTPDEVKKFLTAQGKTAGEAAVAVNVPPPAATPAAPVKGSQPALGS